GAHRRRPPPPGRSEGRHPRKPVQQRFGGAVPELALARPAGTPPRRGPQLNPAIFREYDIRGIAESDFDSDFARALGRTIGTLAAETGKRVLGVRRDCRLTSDRYAAAVSEGLVSTGITVIELGVCPTPL